VNETTTHLCSDTGDGVCGNRGATGHGRQTDHFTLIAAQENAMRNDNVVRGTFNFQWRHADGSKFVEQGKFVINFQKDEMMVDVLGSRCIGSS
jgi:hypothetical protein